MIAYKKGRSANNNLCVSRSGPPAKPITMALAVTVTGAVTGTMTGVPYSRTVSRFLGLTAWAHTGAVADGAVATAKISHKINGK